MSKKSIILMVVLIATLLCGCSTQKHQLKKKIAYKVSTITVKGDFYRTSMGSGFFILYKKKPFFITATHVVSKKTGVCVFDKESRVIKIDNYTPIHIGASDISIYPLRKLPLDVSWYKVRETSLIKGEPVFSCGYVYQNRQYKLIRRSGLYLGEYLMPQHDSMFISTSCKIEHGMSGGPIFDKNNEIVGVVSYGLFNISIERSLGSSIETLKAHLGFFF